MGEIENIIPDYSHQSQTVVARRGQSGQGSLTSASSAPSAALARLADNGISASSTSAATSSPPIVDPKPASRSGSSQQLTSRMDTQPIENGSMEEQPILDYYRTRVSSGRQISQLASSTPTGASNGRKMMDFSQRNGHQAPISRSAKPNAGGTSSSANRNNKSPSGHAGYQHTFQAQKHYPINADQYDMNINKNHQYYPASTDHALYTSASQTILNYHPTQTNANSNIELININNDNNNNNLLNSASHSTHQTLTKSKATSAISSSPRSSSQQQLYSIPHSTIRLQPMIQPMKHDIQLPQ